MAALLDGTYYTPESVSAPSAIFSQAFRRGIIPWTTTMRWLLFATILALWFGTMLWCWLLMASGLNITRPLNVGDPCWER
ncbi:MAG: hypothetical protein ABI212_14700 [Burkholderiaceae bacterium]